MKDTALKVQHLLTILISSWLFVQLQIINLNFKRSRWGFNVIIPRVLVTEDYCVTYALWGRSAVVRMCSRISMKSRADGKLTHHIHGAIRSSPCFSVARGRTSQKDSANFQPELVNEKHRYVFHGRFYKDNMVISYVVHLTARLEFRGTQWVYLNFGGCEQHSVLLNAVFRVS